MELNDFLSKAMPALLADADTKRLILDYLKTITDNERKDTDWREVWHQQSVEVRLLDEMNRSTGIHGIKNQLFLVGRYHVEQRIGIIDAFMGSPHEWGHNWAFDNPFVFLYSDKSITILHQPFPADDYVEVIIQAQQRWNEAYETWLTRTVELRDQPAS